MRRCHNNGKAGKRRNDYLRCISHVLQKFLAFKGVPPLVDTILLNNFDNTVCVVCSWVLLRFQFDFMESYILNETCTDSPNNADCFSCRALAERFMGRTFGLESQKTTISSSGNRVLFVDIQTYDTEHHNFQVFLLT